MCPTSTPCRPRCGGSAASRGRGAAPRTRQQPSCSPCCGWAGVHSLPGTSPPTMARRSTCSQWHRRLWAFWVDQASLTWSDSSAHCDNSKAAFLGTSGLCLLLGKLKGWSLWHRNVLVKLVSRGAWTQDRLSRLRGCENDLCPLCHEGPGTMFHRCYECPALQTERDMEVSQEVRQAARSLEPQYREQFAHGIFPCPSQILPTGALQQPCPVLWHTRTGRICIIEESLWRNTN